jgi:hypothetical protein
MAEVLLVASVVHVVMWGDGSAKLFSSFHAQSNGFMK